MINRLLVTKAVYVQNNDKFISEVCGCIHLLKNFDQHAANLNQSVNHLILVSRLYSCLTTGFLHPQEFLLSVPTQSSPIAVCQLRRATCSVASLTPIHLNPRSIISKLDCQSLSLGTHSIFLKTLRWSLFGNS